VQILMSHQKDAVERILRALEAPAGAGSAGDLRTQAWMACGSGKTRVAAEIADRIASGGRVLVVVPRLALLTQLIKSWRHDGGRRGAMAAVCSLGPGDPALRAHGVRATTNPAQLAWWWHQLQRQGRRTWTVFATYASMRAVAEAHALQLPGIPPLPFWDLLVADEAHHCAGTTGWSLVTDQDAVPAVRRLAMTATPRIWKLEPFGTPPTGPAPAALEGETLHRRNPAVEDEAAPEDHATALTGPAQRDAQGTATAAGLAPVPVTPAKAEAQALVPLDAPLASMDNPALFGDVAYRLTLQDAQALGLVARWQIVAAEIDDPVLRQVVAEHGLFSEQARGLYLAAQQTAVLKAAGQFGLRRVLTYHNRVTEAEAFATTLSEQARRLRGSRRGKQARRGPAGTGRRGAPTAPGGPDASGVARVPETVRVPRRVWAQALSAQNAGAEREAVLGRLAAGTDETGAAADLCVVASVRVLGEGIDVPGVDGVAFVDERCGAIDLVQSVGRALRVPHAERQQAMEAGRIAEKVATIVVPVIYLDEADRDLFGQAWAPLVRLLRALRAHSEEVVGELTRPRTPHRVGSLVELERAQAEQAYADRLMHFLLTDRSPTEIAQFVQLRVQEGLEHDLARAVAAAERYRERTGHLRVPRDHREDDVLLGVQIETWRIAHRKGELNGPLVERLNGLGMQWQPREKTWQKTWEAITTYARQRGHLLPRRDETITLHGTAYPIGQIMTDCRRPSFADSWPGRVEALDELRAPWRVPEQWDVNWQRHLVLADLYLDHGGTTTDLLSDGHGGRGADGGDDGSNTGGKGSSTAGSGGVRYGGENLTRWLARQHQRWPHLKPEQRELLTHHNLAPAETAVTSAPQRRRSRDERFQNLLHAAKRHIEQIGPLTDTRGRHTIDANWRTAIDSVEIRLLQRLNTTRQRRDGLTTQQLTALTQLGLPWAAAELTDRDTLEKQIHAETA
jgi:superfamily II DNA or RNA helicase